jgi:hypothetical protein
MNSPSALQHWWCPTPILVTVMGEEGWAGLPGYLVPLHTAAGPAAHAGQQRAQPAHLSLRQERTGCNFKKCVSISSIGSDGSDPSNFFVHTKILLLIDSVTISIHTTTH